MSNPKSDDHDGGAGYSGPVLDRGQRVMDDVESARKSGGVAYDKAWAWGVEGAKSASRNHEANAWTVEAARAALGGTAEEFNAAKGVLLDAYFPRELGYGPKGVGLWSTEQGSPDNHTHQQLSAVGMARVAAVLSGDADLLTKSEELIAANSALLRALASPAPGYFIGGAPGMRSPGKPVWWWGTAWLRYLWGAEVPMAEFAPRHDRPDLWHDRAALGIRALRYLREKGDRPVVDPGYLAAKYALPKLKYKLTVYRTSDRVLSVLDRPAVPPSNACDWTLVSFGSTYKATSDGTRFGLDWKTPPPDPPKGAEVVHFPSW